MGGNGTRAANTDTFPEEMIDRFSKSSKAVVCHYKDTLSVWAPVILGDTFATVDPMFSITDPLKNFDAPIGYAGIVLSKEQLKKKLRDTLINIVGLGALFLLAGAAVSFLLTKQISRPVKQLVEGVKKYGSEGNCGPLPLSTQNEIGGLANAFHEMTHSLEKQIQRQIDTTKELAHAKNLAELGAASSKVTHEVGNLLNNMELVISTLKSEQLSEQGQKRLEILEKEAVRVKRFITDFLQFAKKPVLHLQEVSLALIIKEVLSSYEDQAEACNVHLELDWPAALPSVPVDRQMVFIAGTNLLKNSIEAIGKNGTIRISGKTNNQDLILTIEDTGPGIDPLIAGEIFEPFLTTKGKKGTGLGLSIVQGIIQAHGGTIRCDSSPGEGARFVIRFPIG